jgi:hypothetical protein
MFDNRPAKRRFHQPIVAAAAVRLREDNRLNRRLFQSFGKQLGFLRDCWLFDIAVAVPADALFAWTTAPSPAPFFRLTSNGFGDF